MSDFFKDIFKGTTINLLTAGILSITGLLIIFIPQARLIFTTHWRDISLVLLILIVLYLFLIDFLRARRLSIVCAELENIKSVSSKNVNKGYIKKLKEELKKEFQGEVQSAKKELDATLKHHENAIDGLRGDIYRTLAHFWESEKSWTTAFIWWMRSAEEFASVGEEQLARIALRAAKRTADKIQSDSHLSSDVIGEYQELFSKISNSTYKIEKDMLEASITALLNKKNGVQNASE